MTMVPPWAITSTVVPRFSNSVPSGISGISSVISDAVTMLKEPSIMSMGDWRVPVLQAVLAVASRAAQFNGP
jgi:hypothetical protein